MFRLFRRRFFGQTAVIKSRPEDEDRAIFNMLRLLSPTTDNVYDVISAAMYAAKSTIPPGTRRRVFVEDFSASLNRRRVLDNKNFNEFREWGFKYMED